MTQVREQINPLRRMRGGFYGWWMVALAAIIMALGNVPVFLAMPVWNPVLRGRFGWTPDQVSWAFAFTRIEGGLFGPAEGLFVERLGSRRGVLIGMLIVGGGFLFFSWIGALWHLYLAFFIMSMGTALGCWLPMMTALNHWFLRRRSMAMAIAMAGYYVGGIVLVPALAWAIGSADPDEIGRFDWRAVARVIGVFLLVLAFPISRLVRNRPEEYGQRPEGDPASETLGVEDRTAAPQPAADQGGFTWQEAIKTRAFWLISFGHALSATVMTTILVHLGLMLDDQGFSLPMIGWVVSVYIAVGIVFNLVGGYVGDRVPIRLAVSGFSVIQSVAIVVLVMAKGSAPLVFLFAVLFGIGFGGRTPLTTSIRGVYFGRRGFASITGMSMVPMSVLLFATPVFTGYMYRYTGYDFPFIVIAIISFLGSCLFLWLGEPNLDASSIKAAGERSS